NGSSKGAHLAGAFAGITGGAMDRRAFFKRSGMAAGGLATLPLLGATTVKKAAAQTEASPIETIKTVCTHCSVGCTVMAEVQDGVWIGQEPGFDSPFSLGGHCAKGASVREHAHGDRRLKYPMKLVGGKYQRISWDE